MLWLSSLAKKNGWLTCIQRQPNIDPRIKSLLVVHLFGARIACTILYSDAHIYGFWYSPFSLSLHSSWSSLEHKPTLAQLVDRRTVAVADKSLGHWFESGRSDFIFASFCQVSFIINHSSKVLNDGRALYQVARWLAKGATLLCSASVNYLEQFAEPHSLASLPQ